MTNRPRRWSCRSNALRFLGVFAIVIGTSLTAPAVAAPLRADISPEGTASGPVVGIGDSFTSGVGTNDVDPASGQCRRSFDSYPLEIARLLDTPGINASCSGATVSAITASFRGQAPQVDNVRDAGAVVMTIGGNDVLSVGNVAALAWDEAAVLAEISALEPALADAFLAVRDATPRQAPVIVLGYPDFFPPTGSGTCGPIVEAIVPNAHRGYDLLNSAIERQAELAGVDFVDTTSAFAGHDVCSAEPWATGIEDWNVALHPNTLGHVAMAGAAAEALTSLQSRNDDKSPSVDTTTPLHQQVPELVGQDTAVLGASTHGHPPVAKEGPNEAVPVRVPHDESSVLDKRHASTEQPQPTEVVQSNSAVDTGRGEPSTTAEPVTELAATGLESPWVLSVGCSLLGTGFGLMWVAGRRQSELTPIVVRSSGTNRRR